MRKITTAITAAALAFSMLASAVPAAAVVGYDSAYAGESAFVNITAGQTQNFQVFFANTGTTAWQRGTGTQVDLAACLEDKVTCNAQDASEATWNSGWLSAVRYATTVQTVTPPGSLGTFSYNITAPAGVAAGIYRFNGDLVLASTGEKIHPDGYYQEANTGVSSGAPTITSLTPNSGPAGTDVVIAGSGFICTPAFPTANFGGSNGTVLSCGASSITVDAPAHALGSATVTVSNSGSGASNGLVFTYTDTTNPVFTSMTVSGDLLMVTFSEPVCKTATGTTGVDWTVNNVSNSAAGDLAGPGSSDNIPLCSDDETITTATIVLVGTTAGTGSVPPGAFVEATLNEVTAGVASPGSGSNDHITDASNNDADAPQSRQATATAPESTAPVITTATGNVSSQTITLNFSEPVWCDPTAGEMLTASDFDVDDTSSTTDPTVTSIVAGTCSTTRADADTSIQITISTPLEADTTYTVAADVEADDVQDAVGNDLADQTVTFTSGAGDFTPPTMVDARVTSNGGTSDFTEAADAFSITFSEVMTDGDEVGTIRLQDQDGTILTLDCASAGVTCAWNDAETSVTVTLTVTTAAPVDPAVGAGTTPGMQIPFNVTTLTGTAFTDTQGNAVNVLGSADRLVDFE